jgi:DUF4097 and DUF4098 domain-containing protein YvlB
MLLSIVSLTAPTSAQTVEEIDVTPGGLLEVNLETGGEVEISGWDRNQVRVEAEVSGRGDGHEIAISQTDRGVEVKAERSKNGWRKSHSRGYDLVVKVPFQFDLEVETMGGGITIDGVEGSIEGETMGGELHLSNLKGDLEISTMGGSITLVDSEVDGAVSTMGGEVLLKNVTGDVDGSSMGGSVIYKNVQRPEGESTGEALVITTMGGAIELAAAPHGAKLETMGGEIVVDSAAEFVEAETMGGDVILREVDGRVVASTMGGDVEVRVVGDPQADDRDIEISSMGGEIRLTVPVDFSMDVEIELAYTKRRAGHYSIESDLDLSIDQDSDSGWDYGHGDARRFIRGSGSFAGGKNKVTISTVNGNVYLRQGR